MEKWDDIWEEWCAKAKEHAEAEAHHSLLDSLTKTEYAEAYFRADANTVKEREMLASQDEKYVKWLKGVAHWREERNRLLAERNALERKLEWIRSVLSYRKKEMELER